eukprot:CAMPEP_0169187694 /NCGR_PEP_ID=MMETSP1016-20121227/3064_1 /TAXON_ID=342587 /ORGANISM="Karlodinium micrum, Strain CCMP2283" /LENGTH=95 /DNA_ID=CAMNT_0009263677 /DNA_START=370 /DNA_END=657 /DNA_ORIENTATION=-
MIYKGLAHLQVAVVSTIMKGSPTVRIGRVHSSTLFHSLLDLHGIAGARCLNQPGIMPRKPSIWFDAPPALDRRRATGGAHLVLPSRAPIPDSYGT